MENFALTLRSKTAVKHYVGYRYEKELLAEILTAIENKDTACLDWFNGFGDSLRAILMNVHVYRKGLQFGFTEIAFDKYGWFVAPKFLDFEIITLDRSEIRIGRGPNDKWAYSLRRDYGCAGASGPLCVFCKQYASREAALNNALVELKADITKYIGNSDTTNYKQDVLKQTLKAIAVLTSDRIQLSLF